jgi:DNA polymerase-3 subunit beta
MNKSTFNTIKKISPARKSLPIIQHTAHVDAMGLTSTNLDTYIHIIKPQNWRVTGAGVISLDVVANLIDAQSVSMGFADGVCSINVDGRTITAPAMDSRDFPALPLENESYEHSGRFIGQDVAGVLDFLSKDDYLRPAMAGAYIGKHIVGTNGHVMRYRRSGFDGVPFILRREVVEAIKVQAIAGKMYKGAAQFWEIEQGKNWISLYRNDIAIYARRINETYPNYLSVIPKDNDKTLTLDVKELETGVKNMAAGYNKTTRHIVLNVDESGAVLMTAKDIDTGSEAKQSINAKAENFGSGFKIGFSSKYLDKVASNVTSKSMTFDIGEANRAAIINNEILLMPIILSA